MIHVNSSKKETTLKNSFVYYIVSLTVYFPFKCKMIISEIQRFNHNDLISHIFILMPLEGGQE